MPASPSILHFDIKWHQRRQYSWEKNQKKKNLNKNRKRSPMLNADVLCLSVSPLFVTLIGKILGSVENCTSSEKKKKTGGNMW